MSDTPDTATPVTFNDLGLSQACIKAVTESGYTIPTEIQAKAIPAILTRRDVIGIARTGTGKTAGFTLPMIDALAGGVAKARMPRALVLAPTRELAVQVAENVTKYSKHTKLTCAVIVGGVAATDQVGALQRGVDVVIATPGRLLDLFERGNLLLLDMKILVIDEADRMLDMGFIPDIERIIKLLPPRRQTCLFSATMPDEIKRLAAKLMVNPLTVSAAPAASPAETVQQNLVKLQSAKQKYAALKKLLLTEQVDNAFIFCNRKIEVAKLGRQLAQDGFAAAPLHGDMPQPKRTEALAAFKAGVTKILVCSDVAARGLDISGVGYVFNYDVPYNADDYIHRIGRTGRAGKSGVSFTLAAGEDDDRLVGNIEKLMGRAIQLTEKVKVAAEDVTVDLTVDTGEDTDEGDEVIAQPVAKPVVAAPPRPVRKNSAPAPVVHKPEPQLDKAFQGFGDDVPAFMKIK